MLPWVAAGYESACTQAYAGHRAIWFWWLPQVCDNNGSNFSGVRAKSTLVL